MSIIWQKSFASALTDSWNSPVLQLALINTNIPSDNSTVVHLPNNNINYKNSNNNNSNHRLRASASTVLTATGQVNGRCMANFDHSQNRNPWADCNKILHNWLRPREDTLNQIWYKSIHWRLLGIWVKYNVFVPFLFIPFFSETRVQVRPVDGFLRAIAY